MVDRGGGLTRGTGGGDTGNLSHFVLPCGGGVCEHHTYCSIANFFTMQLTSPDLGVGTGMGGAVTISCTWP